MLKIFNDLTLFFEDNYHELGIREYSRFQKISPPTASTILKEYQKEDLLLLRKERRYIFFRANRENNIFIDINRAYLRFRLSELTQFLANETSFSQIILFGSLVKGEATISSDIDLFLNCHFREINASKFEKNLSRNIQLHFSEALKNKDLLENIKKGIVLYGEMI